MHRAKPFTGFVVKGSSRKGPGQTVHKNPECKSIKGRETEQVEFRAYNLNRSMYPCHYCWKDAPNNPDDERRRVAGW